MSLPATSKRLFLHHAQKATNSQERFYRDVRILRLYEGTTQI